MIQLIQNIQGNVINEIKGNITNTNGVDAKIQREDYINIYGFTSFLQNFSNIPITSTITKPIFFGYNPPIGLTQKTIDVNYQE
jgi:hypothetical protein